MPAEMTELRHAPTIPRTALNCIHMDRKASRSTPDSRRARNSESGTKMVWCKRNGAPDTLPAFCRTRRFDKFPPIYPLGKLRRFTELLIRSQTHGALSPFKISENDGCHQPTKRDRIGLNLQLHSLNRASSVRLPPSYRSLLLCEECRNMLTTVVPPQHDQLPDGLDQNLLERRLVDGLHPKDPSQTPANWLRSGQSAQTGYS